MIDRAQCLQSDHEQLLYCEVFRECVSKSHRRPQRQDTSAPTEGHDRAGSQQYGYLQVSVTDSSAFGMRGVPCSQAGPAMCHSSDQTCEWSLQCKVPDTASSALQCRTDAASELVTRLLLACWAVSRVSQGGKQSSLAASCQQAWSAITCMGIAL